MRYRTYLIFFIVSLPGLHGCSQDSGPARLDRDRFLANVEQLSSDEFQGRAPMTEGERLTLSFIEEKFREAGLEPLFGGDYRQAVELIAMKTSDDTVEMTIQREDSSRALAYAEEFVAWSQLIQDRVAVEDSEIVFVGYGVVAPEYGWNDYAGLNMRGKTALVLINDPGFALEDERRFKGKAMTYYGRWRYKMEEAARQGAAAVMIIHESEPAAYGWNTVRNSWTGTQYYLPQQPGAMQPVTVESWIHRDAAVELLAASALDLEQLKQAALSATFEPVTLNASVSVRFENQISRGTSYNMGGVIRGTEAADEAVIYTAHWDHIGVGSSEDPSEDVIFNGAVDNATGVAALIELAHAFRAEPEPPRRSVVMLAVTAEESGLLGSAWYAANPVFPMHKTVAGINIDAMPVLGPTTDIMVVGHGSSQLESILTHAAKLQDRTVTPEPHPEHGRYYRSDHFNFAKRGVPMLYAKGGTEHREFEAGYIDAASQEFTDRYYHQPGDEVRDDWDLRGTMEDLELYFLVGREMASGTMWPQWFDGHEFKAIREESLGTASSK